MSFGFDLDGTITSAPDVFRKLMRALVKDDNDVTIITCVCAPNTDDLQRAKVAGLGLVEGEHFTELVLIDGGQGTVPELIDAGIAKVKACSDRGIELYVDDRLDRCAAVAAFCPTLVVMPR